jgi:hypothetical protein
MAKGVRSSMVGKETVYTYDNNCSPHVENGNQMPFKEGDCGTLLMYVSDKGDMYVLGIHYGKRLQVGYAHTLGSVEKHCSTSLIASSSPQWAEACEKSVWNDNFWNTMQDENGEYGLLEHLDPNFNVGLHPSIGVVGKSNVLRTHQSKSKVKRTGMAHGKAVYDLPALTKGSVTCDPRVREDPRSIECQLFDKFHGPGRFPDSKVVTILFDHFFAKIEPVLKTKTVLSVEESLNTALDGYM